MNLNLTYAWKKRWIKKKAQLVCILSSLSEKTVGHGFYLHFCFCLWICNYIIAVGTLFLATLSEPDTTTPHQTTIKFDKAFIDLGNNKWIVHSSCWWILHVGNFGAFFDNFHLICQKWKPAHHIWFLFFPFFLFLFFLRFSATKGGDNYQGSFYFLVDNEPFAAESIYTMGNHNPSGSNVITLHLLAGQTVGVENYSISCQTCSAVE